MNKNEFTKMSDHQKYETYGGWQFLVMALPFIFQALTQSVASMKMITSDSGSMKYQGLESHWDTNKPAAAQKPATQTQVFYAY